jgi:hypothetical protein
MTPDQVKILFEAARTPLLTNEQRDQLQLRNPFECKGPTAELMQAEVSRIAPEQAKAWISESGASMSLAAAAAAQGLMERTPALQAEIERYQPVSQEEKNQERVNWLKAQNPYGTPGRYLDSGEYQSPVAGNLSLAMELEAFIAPEEAAAMRAAASPAPSQEQIYQQQQSLAQANAELRLRSLQQAHPHRGF